MFLGMGWCAESTGLACPVPAILETKGQVMACQTCDHTMQGLADGRFFWCPRCGTLMDKYRKSLESPMLVGRVRDLLSSSDATFEVRDVARRLGVIESAYLPHDRQDIERKGK